MFRTIMITASLLLVWVLPARADLPKVATPTDPGEPRLRTSQAAQQPDNEQNRMQMLIQAQMLRQQQMLGMEQPDEPQGPLDRADLQLTMKALTDPGVAMSADAANQFRDMRQFAAIDHERQNELVPELLGLLRSGRPLAEGNLQIRHKANAALSRLAHVTFGQFAPSNADEDARTDDERILSQWQQWWQKVGPLNSDERQATTAAMRLKLIEEHVEDVKSAQFQHNMDMAREDKDTSPMPMLARIIKVPDIEKKEEIDVALRLYIQFYSSIKPGAEHARPLIEFARAANTPQIAHQTQWSRQLGQLMMQMTGTRFQAFRMEKATIELNGEQKEVNVPLITDDAFKTVEEWMQKELQAEKDGTSEDAPKPAADNPAAVNGAANVIIQQGGGNVRIRINVQAE